MRITDVDTFVLTYPLETPLPPMPRRGEISSLDVYIVRLVADDGTCGFGEAAICDERNFDVAADMLADLVLDREVLDRALIWHGMASVATGSEAKDLGPNGHRDFHAVMSGIDIALWDLAGKQTGLSIARLLGGVRSPRLDCYASGLYLEDDETLVAKARAMVVDGYRAVKMKLCGNADDDGRSVARLRKALGNQVVLLADADSAYENYDDALAVGARLANHDVFWFEDPFRAGRWDDYARLAAAIEPPIAGGETLFGVKPFVDALSANALHVAMADVRLCGGITAARRIADLADLREVRMSLHNGFSPVALMAAANLSAAMPYAERLEVEASQTGLMEAMLVEPPHFENGFLLFEDKPGLGLDIRESFIEDYGREASA